MKKLLTILLIVSLCSLSLHTKADANTSANIGKCQLTLNERLKALDYENKNSTKKLVIKKLVIGKKKSKSITVKWDKKQSRRFDKVYINYYRADGVGKHKRIKVSPNTNSKKIKKLKIGKKYRFTISGLTKIYWKLSGPENINCSPKSMWIIYEIIKGKTSKKVR
jgi:hypothetical protein